MTAYALARLATREVHSDLTEYVERIQSTLDPFDGRFLVHGGSPDVIEGEWDGDVVVIGFPDREAAHAWYESPAYQELVPLRTRHIDGDIVIVGGVGPDYDPAAKRATFERALGAG